MEPIRRLFMLSWLLSKEENAYLLCCIMLCNVDTGLLMQALQAFLQLLWERAFSACRDPRLVFAHVYILPNSLLFPFQGESDCRSPLRCAFLHQCLLNKHQVSLHRYHFYFSAGHILALCCRP